MSSHGNGAPGASGTGPALGFAELLLPTKLDHVDYLHLCGNLKES